MQRREVVVGGRRFSVLAAYTTRGFLFWHIIEGPVTHLTIEAVFRQYLEPMMLANDMLIMDNASIHWMASTLLETERITRGRFKFVPAYSPRCSPIERGFSLIWRYVRAREDEAARDPIGVIQAAFLHYSTQGPMGYKARNHFSAYKSSHDNR